MISDHEASPYFLQGYTIATLFNHVMLAFRITHATQKNTVVGDGEILGNYVA
jgi:hypothetical protein